MAEDGAGVLIVDDAGPCMPATVQSCYPSASLDGDGEDEADRLDPSIFLRSA